MVENKEKIIYYKDELNDDFSDKEIKEILIDEKYKYNHSKIWETLSWINYYIITLPIKIIYPKIKFKIEYKGCEKLKPYKHKAYFVYSNHTQGFIDTYVVSNCIFPKRNYIIVNAKNISMKFLKTFVEMLGAIPIPKTIKATKNFMKKIEDLVKENKTITIFPEAHIWPYYTKIRPFKDVSFKYPAMYNVPIFILTNTYQKDKNNNVKIVSYIDGPFFPDESLNLKDRQKKLRDMAYEEMVKRSMLNNVEVIKYVKEKELL